MRREGLIDLNEAIQHPGTTLTFEVDTDLVSEEDLDLVEPVSGTLEATSTGNILLIRGDFEAKCVMECSRCGEPIEQQIEFKVSDEFQVEGTPAGFGTGEYAKVVEEEDYPLFEQNSLMCDPYLRQGLLVNLPAQPLCEYGWEGSCPNAKDELYESKQEGHPAMQKLKGLLSSEEEE